MCQQKNRKPADRPERWAPTDRPAGGAEPEEDVQKVPPETYIQPDAAGECLCGPGVPGEGKHQAGVHRQQSYRGWKPETDPRSYLDPHFALFYLYASLGG